MSKIRSKDTKPELAVRKMVASLGHGYRLHHKKLPGSPDLAFVTRKKAIFVHGCFWHMHGCRGGMQPKTRVKYWIPKLRANELRDEKAMKGLRELGYDVLVVWECEIERPSKVLRRLRGFLGSDPTASRARKDALLVKLVKKARKSGLSFKSIERKLGLRQANGMTAYRICRGRGRQNRP